MYEHFYVYIQEKIPIAKDHMIDANESDQSTIILDYEQEVVF